MLSLDHVSKSYGVATILDDVSFVVNSSLSDGQTGAGSTRRSRVNIGEHVGLVGPNGSGKSTLLNIIAGQEAPDSGRVSLAKSARLGYLRQGVEPPAGYILADAVRAGMSGWDAARAGVEAAAASMSGQDGAALDQAMQAYDQALARFEALGGYAAEERVEQIMGHLGLDRLAPSAELARLSGGEQTRAGLAAILLAAPDLLLLDEPTNHLDIAALEWLEGFVRDYPGAVLVVSHDRVFLDHTVTRILELDGKTHHITAYTGTYSDYAQQKAQAVAHQWDVWRDQQAEVRRVRQDIQNTAEQARWVERTTTPRQPGVRRYAKKVAKKAKSREKKLERYLESDDRVEKPDQTWGLKLDFAETLRSGQDVLALSDIGHRFEGRGWPHGEDTALAERRRGWLFRHVDGLLRHGDRVALLGPNGAGKSTLLRILAADLEPAEGSLRLGSNVRLGYMPQKQETLDPESTPLDVITGSASEPMTETEARNFLHFFLFAGDDVFTPVGDLSYGERSRLLLAKLVVGGANLLILDEPVNHLDIPSRERFEAALEAFPGTVIAAAHDRAFVARFASTIWRLEDGQLVFE